MTALIPAFVTKLALYMIIYERFHGKMPGLLGSLPELGSILIASPSLPVLDI